MVYMVMDKIATAIYKKQKHFIFYYDVKTTALI